jgi:hypothetical protein
MQAHKLSKELRILFAEYDPAIPKLALGLRSLILEMAPIAKETVYDAGYAVSVHFSFTDRWQDGFCMVIVYNRHVNLGFHQEAKLPDPEKRLKGRGKFMRRVPVQSEADFQEASVRELLCMAIEYALTRTDGQEGTDNRQLGLSSACVRIPGTLGEEWLRTTGHGCISCYYRLKIVTRTSAIWQGSQTAV